MGRKETTPMKKVLRYSNRKEDDQLWDASTPELEDAAFLALFKHLDENWDTYNDMDPTEYEKELQGLVSLKEDLDGGKVNSSLEREARIKVSRIPHLRKEVADCKNESDLYDRAKKGYASAAKELLRRRKRYEYEEWDFLYVKSPT